MAVAGARFRVTCDHARMGLIDRLLNDTFNRSGGWGRGWRSSSAADGDGGMEARVSIIAESFEREERMRELYATPLRANSTWLWTGDRWKKWSTVWKDYDEVEETDVPTPLLDLLGAHGVTPTAGDRFRFVDGEWTLLDPGAPDELPPEPDGETDAGGAPGTGGATPAP